MATTSTVPTVKQTLVTLFSAALTSASTTGLAIPFTYAWPGPDTGPEAGFLGRHPELADVRLDSRHDIPTIKAGRKQRQENYTVPVTVWQFRGDLTTAGAESAEAAAYTVLGLLEDVLADDPTLGLGAVVQWAKAGDHASTLFPFQKGWACEIVLDVDVAARLT